MFSFDPVLQAANNCLRDSMHEVKTVVKKSAPFVTIITNAKKQKYPSGSVFLLIFSVHMDISDDR